MGVESEDRLTSMVCRRAHWDLPWFAQWNAYFADASPAGGSFLPENVQFHRKAWEWAAIVQALHERGMMAPGMRGCGFAVGREPLACLFAGQGVEVLATDLGAAEGSAQAWSTTGQHAASLDALYWPKLIDRPAFDARVRFMPQDMRALEPDKLGTHDFIWSSCSFEHLGGLEAGLQFVLRSTELLRPGGIAVHTTEFNLSSEDTTVATGDSVIYRRKDISALAHRLRLLGCGMERFDDFAGTAPEDLDYDYEPYYENGRQHIKMMMGGFVTTSCLLIITKGRYPAVLPSIRAMALSPTALAAPGTHAFAAGRFDSLRASAFWQLTAPLRAPLRRFLRR